VDGVENGRFFSVRFHHQTKPPRRRTSVSKGTIKTRIEATPETMGALETIMREGARKLLQAALEAEIEEHLTRYKELVDDSGKRIVVRNGTMPERTVLTGIGPIPITRSR
jgi:transposase-like protein